MNSCSNCKYFLPNAKIPNVREGWLCTKKENLQTGYYRESFMETRPTFLCNEFEEEEINE